MRKEDRLKTSSNGNYKLEIQRALNTLKKKKIFTQNYGFQT